MNGKKEPNQGAPRAFPMFEEKTLYVLSDFLSDVPSLDGRRLFEFF